MLNRPRAPTPSNNLQTQDEWPAEYDHQYEPPSPSSAYIVDSPSNPLPSPSSPPSHFRQPLSRSASEEEESSFVSDSGHAHSPVRSPKLPGLPDPSQYPDPYPFRPPHWMHGASTPALSTTDSSSASTRSSAYTNSARSGDYGHVHVALGNDEPDVGVGITTDDVVQLLAQERANASSASQSKLPAENSRWSDLYANSTRSRSSSGHGKSDSVHENEHPPRLRTTPSFDVSWQAVDERDEIGLTSEDETDDYGDDDDVDDEGDDELPTSAMIIAEEGLGVIVQGGNVPIHQIHVKPGTTHLLIGSCSTPNAIPSFVTNAVPHITTTLLALDISANFLVALPPALGSCICLEELNIAANPLRALPVFLSNLTSLKVLIADSTGLSTLPPQLGALDKLHSLSIRRNKMNSLPSWLCLLPSLETLLVDGNPFQGPWKALVEPLLAKSPMSPLYPPSTPIFPPPSASIQSTTTVETDIDDMPDSPPTVDGDTPPFVHIEDEDTITPARAPHLTRSITAPSTIPPSPSPTSPSLARTRTTPSKAYYDRNRAANEQSLDREVRKMKSAGELRRNFVNPPPDAPPSLSTSSSPLRPGLSRYGSSASSSNLLAVGTLPGESSVPKRFASLGVSAAYSSPGGGRMRPGVDPTLWDNISGDEAEESPPVPPQKPLPSPSKLYTGSPPRPLNDARSRPEVRPGKEEKSGRWGFLKKMSMGKMRSEPPSNSRPDTAQGRPILNAQARPMLTKFSSSSPAFHNDPRLSTGIPQIDVRISTTGMLLNPPGTPEMIPPSLSKKPSMDMLKLSPPPPPIPEKPSMEQLKPPPSAFSNNNLLVPTPTPRATKRRSFLPIDVAPIPIPDASSFVPNLTATSDADDGVETARAPPQAMTHESLEQLHRREEEKAREARTRALRSVMAYLRDMHDLGLSQSNTLSIYGGLGDPNAGGLRSRRPTVVENNRLTSEGSTHSIISSLGSRPESSVRSSSMRSGTTTQTNSVATTDSNGSNGEERKYKDDKSKRARVVREIIETERTYVKGLQELVDIYIKPAGAPVNVLSGVGQSKDTVIPAAERKVVFQGLESLFSFHKASFLPALERAAAPVMRPSDELLLVDADGETSMSAARAVAQAFVSHAAFMKMYSTYINNFDNSVQRIKAWLSDRSGSPGQSLSPSSSSAGVVGLGLAMSAISTPGVMPDGGPVNSNLAPLTSSQKKRIKSYLKRCRMNPRHSQLNLEGYLLLPVQRIPRYKLLLEELLRSCPPVYEYMEDPLDKALSEISVLATNMNEGKRESESRRRLVLWQSRIRGKFPSPLVQPHRRLIMDGRLHLTRVVRKATVSFEVIDSKGDASTVQVECLSPELTPRSLVGVLCNDLLVLCRDPSDGQEPNSMVDLWAVLRMQTLPQPATIVHGNALRLVDNKAILYFDVPSNSEALTWFRAINLNMAQKT
ncbi:unnamed protein product [Somion occarium]|uniref:DH domain-containing protein n=1 Tax=Somion occarium TaxID=3059160 RepID=A0ABP1CMS3_9APHY